MRVKFHHLLDDQKVKMGNSLSICPCRRSAYSIDAAESQEHLHLTVKKQESYGTKPEIDWTGNDAYATKDPDPAFGDDESQLYDYMDHPSNVLEQLPPAEGTYAAFTRPPRNTAHSQLESWTRLKQPLSLRIDLATSQKQIFKNVKAQVTQKDGFRVYDLIPGREDLNFSYLVRTAASRKSKETLKFQARSKDTTEIVTFLLSSFTDDRITFEPANHEASFFKSAKQVTLLQGGVQGHTARG